MAPQNNTPNSQLKRAYWHDYKAPGRYHITLSKAPDVARLSAIEGDWKLPVGAPGSSFTKWSPLGKIIAAQIYNFSEIHPAIRADQFVVMPDHVHILLWIKEALPEHVGFYIARFKNAVNLKTGMDHVFSDGYNDRIVTPKRNLDTIFRYIKANPYRLAVRMANPDYFRLISNLTIDGTSCQAYGNIHLLDNPFKDQVIVHRADTPAIFSRKKDEWLYTAANGGVLVSPFISKAEKEIRRAAEGLGGRVILIVQEAFGERYKPAAHDFELCSEGRMLIISVGMACDAALSREICQKMNAFASKISEPAFQGQSSTLQSQQ